MDRCILLLVRQPIDLRLHLTGINHFFSDRMCVVYAPHSIHSNCRNILERFVLDWKRQSVAIPPGSFMEDMPSCWLCAEVPVLPHVLRVCCLCRAPFNRIVVPKHAAYSIICTNTTAHGPICPETVAQEWNCFLRTDLHHIFRASLLYQTSPRHLLYATHPQCST